MPLSYGTREGRAIFDRRAGEETFKAGERDNAVYLIWTENRRISVYQNGKMKSNRKNVE